MSDVMLFLYEVVARCIEWLKSWSYAGVPFLVWLMALAIVIIILDRIFG